MEKIQEQFVSYEIALAMKELGFNEPCLGYYRNDSKSLFIGEDSRVQKDSVQAPLLQQCIDWFREKYDLHVVITVNPYSEINEVNGFKIYDGNKELNCISNQETQTWSNYKAREQAILKCIGLCKNK